MVVPDRDVDVAHNALERKAVERKAVERKVQAARCLDCGTPVEDSVTELIESLVAEHS